ncbi:MAG: MFS transporter [Pseudomonadota bacterium]
MDAQRAFRTLCGATFLAAISYGCTFLLPALLASRGGDERLAGAAISVAAATTVLAVLLSGHLSDRLAPPRALALACLFLGLASLGAALPAGLAPHPAVPAALLGFGWGVAYNVIPLAVATLVPAAERLRHFTVMSGWTMAGIGMGPLIGRLAGAAGLAVEWAFAAAAVAAAAAAALFFSLRGVAAWLRGAPGQAMARISPATTRAVLRSRAAFPIAVVGLAGCIFGGLSTFQTSYSAAHGLDYSLYFVGFMATAIFSRLALSRLVEGRDAATSATVLLLVMAAAISLFALGEPGPLRYFFTAALVGFGYGLSYPLVNGLAANEAPAHAMPQALLLFSLSYLVGIFLFPLLVGRLIAARGADALLAAVLGACALQLLIAFAWLAARARARGPSRQI